MIEKSVSTEMKAIAIIMVVAGHFLNAYYQIRPSLAIMFGTGGVTIFLMLSGYGIVSSYYKSGLHIDYWTKKLSKIYVPYLIVTVVWILIAKLYRLEPTVIFKNLIMLDFNRTVDGTMWYLSYLLIWYVLFFVIFVFDYSIIVKIVLLFGFSYLLYQVDNMSVFSDCTYQFCRNAFSFPLGVLIGTISKSSKESSILQVIDSEKRKVIIVMLTVIAIAEIAVFLKLQSDSKALVQLNGIFVFLIVFILCRKITGNRIKHALLEVGQISYFLYLIEGKCFSAVSSFGIANHYLNSVIYLLVLTALGVCYFVYKRIKTANYCDSKT